MQFVFMELSLRVEFDTLMLDEALLAQIEYTFKKKIKLKTFYYIKFYQKCKFVKIYNWLFANCKYMCIEWIFRLQGLNL